MTDSIEISLMTTYLIRNILVENRNNIQPVKSSIVISENPGEIDIKKILKSVYQNSLELSFVIKKLETLLKIYQIHSKQKDFQSLVKLKSEILEILGYREN